MTHPGQIQALLIFNTIEVNYINLESNIMKMYVEKSSLEIFFLFP